MTVPTPRGDRGAADTDKMTPSQQPRPGPRRPEGAMASGRLMAGSACVLAVALEFRAETFPGARIVFCAVDQREVRARQFPPDVVGVPVRFDLTGTLDLALRLHPKARRVYVVAGKSRFDNLLEAEARQAFQP